MSIDHGKLLTKLLELASQLERNANIDFNNPHFTQGRREAYRDSAKQIRALAQPAEAVEGGDGELLNDLEAEVLLAWPRGVEQRFVGAREQRIAKLCKRAIAALAHGAAQGAVAWYVFADTEKWVTLDRSEADDQRAEGCQVRPLIFGDTHPQAAPAQGDGKEWVAGYMQGANDYVGGAQGALDQDELRADAEMAQRHYSAMLAAAPSQEGES